VPLLSPWARDTASSALVPREAYTPQVVDHSAVPRAGSGGLACGVRESRGCQAGLKGEGHGLSLAGATQLSS
jgi:hypothetical protein